MKRSKMSLSHTKLLSCDMGELVPCGLVEVLPGDSLQAATSLLVRTQPLLAPVMHPVDIRCHYWFVPHRIVWEDWEDFITGGPDGMDDSVFPTVNLTYSEGPPATGSGVVGGLADYLGMVPEINNLSVSALPFRGYAMIYNEWYRDQDLVPELAISLASGVDSTTSTALKNIAWEKDYLTSSRPWEQKGPSITIPIGSVAPVVSNGQPPQFIPQSGSGFSDPDMAWDSTGNVHFKPAGSGAATPNTKVRFGDETGLEADLTGVSSVTVTVLREAMALQRYEEARARYGSRYVEYLRYLGVRSSDARLQRPEYLGGARNTIQFSEVLQTAEGTNPVGELRGHGIGATRSRRWRRFFEEHGYVFMLMSIRPKTIYAQGLPRTFNRRTKEDFWQVELQHIGQQEVLNKEVYAAGASPDGVFGFQDRYDEYRRQTSSIAGEFRTSALDYWHLARIFASAPALNSSFVECVPTDRIFPSQDSDTLYVTARHSIQARRMVAASGSSFIF